jgi:hypothetical protein
MTETTGEVRVRSVRTRQNDSVIEQAVEFGGGVVRLGFSVFTLPFALLPSESRQHMRNATKELMYAFAALPAEFSNIAGEAVEKWAAEQGAATVAEGKAPKDELVAK